MCLGRPAWAQTNYTTSVATFGDQNSSNNYRMTATNDGVIRFASDTGIIVPYTTASTNSTLTAAQTGTTIVFNNGSGTAQSNTTFTLPTSAVGMQYSFIGDITKYFRVKPASGEIINYSTAVANSKLKNSSAAIGDSIIVFCATAGQWSVKAQNGTWAVDNT